MRIAVVILLNLVFTTLTAWADEKLPVLKVGTDVYSNVTVTTITSTDIYFSHDKGMGNAKLKKLDPELQKRFKYDAAKADAVEKQQKAGNIQYSISAAAATNAPHKADDRADAKAAMDEAIARVQAIVNQPVKHLPQTPNMNVAVYKEGWFHPGAEKPDFKTVDVRATQQFLYDQHPYVTSSANPGVVFVGPELEFNSMTKCFYVDRSLPKKKLTQAEMLEINRLYRIIGESEDTLSASPKPKP